MGAGTYGIRVPAGFGVPDAEAGRPVVAGAVEGVEVVEEGAVMMWPILAGGRSAPPSAAPGPPRAVHLPGS